MIKTIQKTIKIINIEAFNGVRNRILLNVCVLLFLVGLQLGDITLKISSNYFAMIWISINTYYICSLFIEENRAFILSLSQLSNLKKVILLSVVAIIMNLHNFIFIFIQLVIVMKATVVNTIIITITQYLFAISFGLISSILYKKNIGLIIILILGVINFINYNPYNYEAASHFFSLSEALYSVNSLNMMNVFGLIIMSLGFVTISFILLNLNDKYRHIKIVCVFCVILLIYLSAVYISINEYENLNNSKFFSYNVSVKDLTPSLQ